MVHLWEVGASTSRVISTDPDGTFVNGYLPEVSDDATRVSFQSDQDPTRTDVQPGQPEAVYVWEATTR